MPTPTGAARATTRAVPELSGRFDGIALRAPNPVGSIADIIFVAHRATTVEGTNHAFRHPPDDPRGPQHPQGTGRRVMPGSNVDFISTAWTRTAQADSPRAQGRGCAAVRLAEPVISTNRIG